MRRTQITTLLSSAALCGSMLLAGCQQIRDASSAAGSSIGQVANRLTNGKISADQVDAGVDAAQSLSLGDAEAEGFGQTLALKLSQSPGYVTDAQTTAYVQEVGLTVASVCGRDDLDFVFGVLNDDRVNAVSGPRGYVFVTRGLLKLCKDESELAGVLAHEIGHVAKDHGLSAVKQTGLTKAGLRAAAGTSQVQSFSQWGDLAGRSADKLVTGVYSQSQEDEADRLAVQYCQTAGYDPDGLARVLARAYSGQGSTPFASHPSTADRMGRIRSAITRPGGQTLAARFAANVHLGA